MSRFSRSRFTQLVMTGLLGGILSLSAGVRDGAAWNTSETVTGSVGLATCTIQASSSRNGAYLSLTPDFFSYSYVDGQYVSRATVITDQRTIDAAVLSPCGLSSIFDVTSVFTGTSTSTMTVISLAFSAIINDGAQVTLVNGGQTILGDGATFYSFEFSLSGLANETPTFSATVVPVVAHNTPPVISSNGAAPADGTAIEDVASPIDLSAYAVSDPDAGDTITLTLAVDRGTIASTDGDGVTSGVTIANSGSTSMTLAGTAAALNTYLDDTTKTTFTTDLNDTTAATLTVTPNDGTVDGTADTVGITITAVNDEPSLSIDGSNQSVNASAGGAVQTVNSFASMSDDGDADATQSVADFIVSEASDDNNVVSSVDISDSGVLTYTPAAGVTGVATINVAVQDDGGTANSGDDTSAITQFTISVESTVPTVAITALSGPSSGEYTATISLSEDSTDFVVGNLTLVNAKAVLSGSGTSYTVTLTPSADGLVSVTVPVGAFSDAAGNDNTAASNTASATFDSTEPTTTITTGGVLGFNESTLTPFTATVTFNETVAGFTDGELTATNASVGTISGTGPYTFLVTPDGGGNVALNVAANVATDGAGNDNTIASTVTVTQTDDIVPTLTITTDSGGSFNQSAPGIFTATVNFNEVVTGFTDGELTATNASLATLSGSGTTYTVVVTPTGTGNVVLSVAGSVAIDGASNNNNAATDVTVIQTDDVAPRISSIERNIPTTETTDADTLIWRVTFDDVVTGVDTSDFSVSGTTATITGVTAVSTSIYDVTVSGGDLAELNATVTLAVQPSGSSIIDTPGNIFANSTPTGTNDNTFILSNTIGSTVVVVTSPDGGDVPDGGTDDQGNQQAGVTKTVTYTFTNTGSSPITLNGSAPTVSGSKNAGTPNAGNYSTPFSSATNKASLLSAPTTYALAKEFTQTAFEFAMGAIITPAHATPATITLQPGESTSFEITYTPSDLGAFSIELDIESSAGVFDVAMSGTAVDTSAPTIAIQSAPANHDGSTAFNVTFEFSEDVIGFELADITVGYGTASNFIAVDDNTYTADITPEGSLSIKLDVAANVATDGTNGNNAAAQIIVTGPIVSQTQTAIADFMSNRAGHILNNQPDMIGFITNANNGGGGPLGNLQLESDLDSQTTMSFFTSRSKILAAREGGFGKGVRPTLGDDVPLFASADRFGAINNELKGDDALGVNSTDALSEEEQLAAQAYNGSDRTGSWDVWTQINGAKSSQTNIDSEFWSANFGTHYFISNDVLIGMLTQFDWAEETNSSVNSTVSGNGFMVGPYIAGKLKEHALFYEARALWGKSSNDISPIGTYTDSFDTERWLASIKVQGSYDIDDQTKLKPEVSISYFEETQEAYTDTNSNLIPEQTISLGEFKFGPSITRTFDAGSGFTLRTSVGVSGIMNFGVNNANTSTGNAFANEVLRARVDAGFELENEYGIRFTAAGFYDGIGINDYQSYGGTLGLVVPFN